ncbi:uncharacterized protein [Apostichopus japonicus]|uniref:uncharacterized protein isoform X2 n=1 Tax=Stichopus japonicus TaxID=307972 RepID=UPI003AB3E1DC
MRRNYNYKTEPIDQYLSSVGLYRKITAKDGSCLFRAVAEQMFYTQVFHYAVREACISFMSHHREQFEPFIPGSFDHYLYHLKNPKEWAGQVEISALSLLYKRDFLIYQFPGKPPSDVTQNGFDKRIMLCFSHGNHYDSVFTKTFQQNAAVCQAVLYEILYKEVFKVPKEADQAVDILRESASEPAEMDERLKKRPPLPYRVAKALDPEMYRNVEFDSWNENKKDQQQQDLILARGLQFSPGEKCQVSINSDNNKKFFEGHIQEVAPGNGSVTVFIQEIGEKRTVPMRNIRPIVSFPHQVPMRLPSGNSYKNLPGYYQKYSADIDGIRHRERVPRRGKQPLPAIHHSFQSANGLPFEQQNIPYPPHPSDMQSGRVRQRMPAPHKQQPPRFINRNVNQNEPFRGRGMSNRRGKGYDYHRNNNPNMDDSQDNELENQEFQEALRYIELAERDQMSFPSLPSGSNGPGESTQRASFWSRYRPDHSGRSSVSPTNQHPGTPSPINHPQRDNGNFHNEMEERVLTTQMQHINIEGNTPVDSEVHYTVPSKGGGGGGGEIDMNQMVTMCSDSSQVPPNSWAIPSSIVTSSTGYQITSSSGPSPQTASPQTVYSSSTVSPSVSVGLPFYPMLIPVSDNLIGPINPAADISQDPNGTDLPSDVSTLRYFYNIGVEYQRRLCMIQYQQQTTAVPPTYAQIPGHHPVTMFSTMPVVHNSMGHMQPMMTSQDTGQLMVENQVTASSSISEEADEGDDRLISTGQEASSQQFTDVQYQHQSALSSHSSSPSIHPIQASLHPSGPHVIYQQPPGAINQVPSMAPYVVPNVSQWQAQIPYANPGKMNPVNIQSNSQVTLLANNSPLHISQMPQQQHLVHQGGPLMTPSVHGLAPASMYTSS